MEIILLIMIAGFLCHKAYGIGIAKGRKQILEENLKRVECEATNLEFKKMVDDPYGYLVSDF